MENTTDGSSCIIGKNNGKTHTLGSSYVFGENNNSYDDNGRYRAGGVMIGYDNSISGNYQTMIFGHGCKSGGMTPSGPQVIVGNYLIPKASTSDGSVLLGRYNKTTFALRTPLVIIAAGTGSSSALRKNAIEIDSSQCKILHDLQLASDTTAVNAIDAPADPSNPTTEEKTLATLGSLQALKDVINNAHLQRREVLLTGQTTLLTTGTAYDLESTFSITIPSWASRLRLGYQIAGFGTTQNYVEFSTVGGTFSAFSIRQEPGTLFGVNLTYADKTLTINKVMSIDPTDNNWKESSYRVSLISINAFGNFSI